MREIQFRSFFIILPTIVMAFSQTPRIFTTFVKLIRGSNKASLVNMLVTFCGKL